MKQTHHTLQVKTGSRAMYAITDAVNDWISESGIQQGLLTLLVQHTSASLLIQENADPDVQHDLERFFSRLVPDGDPIFVHAGEGPDDMSAHIRTVLTQTQLTIPVINGTTQLGTWQGIFLCEHRTRNRQRQVLMHIMGE